MYTLNLIPSDSSNTNSLPAYSKEPLLPRYDSCNTLTTQPSRTAWPGTETAVTTTNSRAARPSRAEFWAKTFLTFVFLATVVLAGLGAAWIIPGPVPRNGPM
ncbi:uncharacterized protein BO80DRAFT_448594 [Aspergillus ibericus CBS 121593]|uniref:Uncharacterized protein n=1 Tax=Aspergillus ibericus CBS 121593 TaxID=1448316 RepID=A0A395GPG6_9EURO|nr:hypothetical protein BO80DRAFT_448594 [Aspergillus ibericus CBS 121593]RAK97254.1 hypothetical protein BO80DRAFT_448594 [Aspergillus ibericus CBS 121593]